MAADTNAHFSSAVGSASYIDNEVQSDKQSTWLNTGNPLPSTPRQSSGVPPLPSIAKLGCGDQFSRSSGFSICLLRV